jgi:hypothetical protein
MSGDWFREWPWALLALLGAYHGLNPAMGWLFALALGLQEKRRSAVFVALLPIALGHAIAIGVTVLLLRFVQYLVPLQILKWAVAAILFALGIYRLFRSSHPRSAGMRVGNRDLLVWSFLMSSAHGAGLMILPILMSQQMPGMTHMMMGASSTQAAHMSMPLILAAVLVHTMAMLLVAGILAIFFFETYERTGLKLLQRTWLNFDLIWAVALLIAGIAALWF